MDNVALVEWLLQAVRAYLFAGLVFSVPLILFGLQRVDPDARWSWNLGFRLMILPGLCAFWPLFATRLLRRKQRPIERNAHRIAAQGQAGGAP
ncbi:hypothetical protein [Acaryochloris thomasi]|uniref:hypothetical protein n=1 Tax=Acaryochloris thomasi TaxID=2929456 RepID=UPI000DA698EC|nr:hypothetical protein [Acaryochloris thomasi]